MEIVIGTKAWSTWSLRPWLALKRTGVAFTETLVELRKAEATTASILPHSPSGLVPALKDGDLTVWDSLAICEYLAERFPAARLWPEDPATRAVARSVTAEMHSGFMNLRRDCPMDLALRTTAELSPEVAKDVRRIAQIWSEQLARSGGPFLFGAWSIADAFYTPVATRFRSYGVDLAAHGASAEAQAYRDALLATPEFLDWEAAA
ncbi:glutathione S-transferase family protein [Caulobacter mirabilis]|uniref:Glutathione S-transferase n=1 Tax=Caulobacter mirabilis TaxID=69666 RepID=A0A2D2AVN9_9CAUL|nr:glutathione S-transferase family protein [Caulobacter mirabilis]ATQ42063.1 glutathione S-transferase [Caulobacter mirabilis]